MLARTFKTATDLGISENVHDGLISTLLFFESGEVPQFNMRYYFRRISEAHPCKTPSCIAGWASTFSSDIKRGLDRGWSHNYFVHIPDSLARLFGLGWASNRLDEIGKATLEQGTTALRNYLTTGEACWEEVLA